MIDRVLIRKVQKKHISPLESLFNVKSLSGNFSPDKNQKRKNILFSICCQYGNGIDGSAAMFKKMVICH